MTILLVLALLGTALGRIWITPVLTPSITGTYEAVAHLLVGFLILVPFYDPQEVIGPSKALGWIGWALAGWELAWFVGQKSGVL